VVGKSQRCANTCDGEGKGRWRNSRTNRAGRWNRSRLVQSAGWLRRALTMRPPASDSV